MEFMTTAIGILAMVGALVLLFGPHQARNILLWTALALLWAVVLGAIVVAFRPDKPASSVARDQRPEHPIQD